MSYFIAFAIPTAYLKLNRKQICEKCFKSKSSSYPKHAMLHQEFIDRKFHDTIANFAMQLIPTIPIKCYSIAIFAMAS